MNSSTHYQLFVASCVIHGPRRNHLGLQTSAIQLMKYNWALRGFRVCARVRPTSCESERMRVRMRKPSTSR